MSMKYQIEVFLDSNLSFTVRVFALGLANDNNICKKAYVLSNLINNKIN